MEETILYFHASFHLLCQFTSMNCFLLTFLLPWKSKTFLEVNLAPWKFTSMKVKNNHGTKMLLPWKGKNFQGRKLLLPWN